ncbi:hypothetical protein [Sphingomonas sp.]|uniref:hypothetical protein n=1 Tax=Sphingomonas sp. TaxID=28214 RepID=UPI002DD65C03|nr:hypothetical protein [Sphingomonas sp.]
MPVAVSAMAVVATPAVAQFGAEASASKQGFAFPKEQPVRILVFRPDVRVGEQTTGGLNQPNADWTAAARQHIADALDAARPGGAQALKPMPELEGEDGKLLADYRALFRAVTDAVVSHKLFAGNRLPTKRAEFNWTLGPGVARLGEIGGGDYGLFLFTNDSYGSAGRKAAQVMGLLFGAYIPSGVHVGYAGLVDLKTGELVWINADVAMGGDVREADGAIKRVGQLLEDFPRREGDPAPVRAAAK